MRKSSVFNSLCGSCPSTWASSSLCKRILAVTSQGSRAPRAHVPLPHYDQRDPMNKTQSLRSLDGRKFQKKIHTQCKEIFLCSFTKLFHPRTALERPKSSPLMWPPGKHTGKQSKTAKTLQFLIVEACNRQCFPQEAQLGERQTTRSRPAS